MVKAAASGGLEAGAEAGGSTVAHPTLSAPDLLTSIPPVPSAVGYVQR